MERAIAVALLLVLYIPLALWKGFVLSKLWGWHVTTMFDVPSLSTVQAAAFALVVSLLLAQKPDDDEPLTAVATTVTTTLIVGAWCLLFGWIFALWLGVA